MKNLLFGFIAVFTVFTMSSFTSPTIVTDKSVAPEQATPCKWRTVYFHSNGGSFGEYLT